MAESNIQVTFLIDPSFRKTSDSEVFLQTLGSLLDSELPSTGDNYDVTVSKDQFQWGHKYSLKNTKFERHERCEAVSFNSAALKQLDISSHVTTTGGEFGVRAISDNMTVMLHDFQWDRLQVRSPVKKSNRGRGYPVKGSNSHGFVDSDGLQSICQSFYNDDLEQKRPTNVICIVGPIPKNIQRQMKELQQSKHNSKQPVKSFLTTSIFEHLEKLENVKMYWVDTGTQKPHTNDLALVSNTLNKFHGCVLPISLFQQQFSQRCEKCHQVTTVPNQVDLPLRSSLALDIINRPAVFPISYLIKSQQKMGRMKQQAKQNTALKCSFVCDDDEVLGRGTFQVSSKEPLHVSNAVNKKWLLSHPCDVKFPFLEKQCTIHGSMCHGQCLDNFQNNTSEVSFKFRIKGVVKKTSIPIFTAPIHHIVELFDSWLLDWITPKFVLVVEAPCLAVDHEKHVGLVELITGRSLTISWLRSQPHKYMWLRNDDINEYKRRKVKTNLDEQTQQVVKKELELAIEKQRHHETQIMPNKNDDTTVFIASKFRPHHLERYFRVLSCHSRNGNFLKNELKSCVSSRNDYAAKKSEEIPSFASVIKEYYVKQKIKKQMAKKVIKKKPTSKHTQKVANELEPAPNHEVKALGSWNEAVQRCIVELQTITTASEGEFEQLKLQTGAYFVCTLLHKFLVMTDMSPKENNAAARNVKNFKRIWQACKERVLPTVQVTASDDILDKKVKTARLQLQVYLLLELYKMRSNLVGTPASDEDNKIFNEAARTLLVDVGAPNFMPYLNEYLIPNYVDTAGRVLANVVEEGFLPLPEELKMYGDDDMSSVCSSSVMGPSISSRVSSHYSASTGRTSVESFSKRERRQKYTRGIPLYPQTREVNVVEDLDKKSDRLLQVAEDSPSENSRRTSNRNRGVKKDYKITKQKGARRNLFSTSSTGAVGTKPISPPKYKSDDDDDEHRKLRSRTVSVKDTPNAKQNMGSALQRQRHRARKKNCTNDEELEMTVAESPTKPYLPSDPASRVKQMRNMAKDEFYSGGQEARATQLAIRQLRLRTKEQADRSKSWHSPRTRMFGWINENSHDSKTMNPDDTGLQDASFRSPEPSRCDFASPTKNKSMDAVGATQELHDSGFSPDYSILREGRDVMDAIFEDCPFLECYPNYNDNLSSSDLLHEVSQFQGNADYISEHYYYEGSIRCGSDIVTDTVIEGEDTVTLPTSSQIPPSTFSPKMEDGKDVPSSKTAVPPSTSPPKMEDGKDTPSSKTAELKKVPTSPLATFSSLVEPTPPPCSFMSPRKGLRSDRVVMSSLNLESSSFLSPNKSPVVINTPEPKSPPLQSLQACSLMFPKRATILDCDSEDDTSPPKWSSLLFSQPEPISPPTLSLPAFSFISPKKRKSIDKDTCEHAMTEPKRQKLDFFRTKTRRKCDENNYESNKKTPGRSLFKVENDEHASEPAVKRKSFYRTASKRDLGECSSSSKAVSNESPTPKFTQLSHTQLPTVREFGLRRTLFPPPDEPANRRSPRRHMPPPRLQRFQCHKEPTEDDHPLSAVTAVDTSWFDKLGAEKASDSEDDSDVSCIVLLSPVKANKANRVSKVNDDSLTRDLWLSEDDLSREGAEEQNVSIKSPETTRSYVPSPDCTPLNFELFSGGKLHREEAEGQDTSIKSSDSPLSYASFPELKLSFDDDWEDVLFG